MKQNCWEIMKCGRQAGGGRVLELGLCPASVERRLDGVHDGRNAGRACWVVAGTLCGGDVQGYFAQKFHDCAKCQFYIRVQSEEFPRFTLAPVLLATIENRGAGDAP